MRVLYSDEEEYGGEFALWQANCERSLAGRKGQRALQRLDSALERMPAKRLEHEVLVEPGGAVCAIGAQVVEERIEEEGRKLGMPRLVAWAVAVENDQERHESPEERYEWMVGWVRKRIKQPDVEAGIGRDQTRQGTR